MQFSQEFIYKIKSAIDLSKIAAKYTQLQNAGQMRYKGLCPFHNEKTPSFVVNDDTSSYYCFGCGEGGDIISLLEKLENNNFVEAVQYLANYAGIDLPKENVRTREEELQESEDLKIISAFNDFFIKELKKNEEASNYLHERGIKNEIIKKFNIGYAAAKDKILFFIQKNNFKEIDLLRLGIYAHGKYGNYFIFSERVVFPIINYYGKIVAFGGRVLNSNHNPKYINSPAHAYFQKNELFYNFYQAKNDIRKTKKVIICEGYMDVIAFANYGFSNVIATLGTAFNEKHILHIWHYVDSPIVCLDGDDAGRRAMLRIAHLILPILQTGKSVDFVVLPHNQDPDDLLKNYNGVKLMNDLLVKKISLADILSRHYLSVNAQTPEEKNKILANLKNLAEKINDKNIKYEYLKYFKDKYYTSFRNKSFVVKKQIDNSILEDVFSAEMNLCAFIVLYPQILENEIVVEDFAKEEFSNKKIKLLRDILYTKIIDEGLNAEELRKFLENNKDICDNAFFKKISAVPNIAKIDIDIKKQWHILCQDLLIKRLQFRYSHINDDEQKEYLKDEIEMQNDKLNKLY